MFFKSARWLWGFTLLTGGILESRCNILTSDVNKKIKRNENLGFWKQTPHIFRLGFDEKKISTDLGIRIY